MKANDSDPDADGLDERRIHRIHHVINLAAHIKGTADLIERRGSVTEPETVAQLQAIAASAAELAREVRLLVALYEGEPA